MQSKWVPECLRAVPAPRSTGVSPIDLQVMFREDRKARERCQIPEQVLKRMLCEGLLSLASMVGLSWKELRYCEAVDSIGFLLS